MILWTIISQILGIWKLHVQFKEDQYIYLILNLASMLELLNAWMIPLRNRGFRNLLRLPSSLSMPYIPASLPALYLHCLAGMLPHTTLEPSATSEIAQVDEEIKWVYPLLQSFQIPLGKLATGDSSQVTDMGLPSMFAKFASQVFLSSCGSSTSLLLMSRHDVVWGSQNAVLIVIVFF